MALFACCKIPAEEMSREEVDTGVSFPVLSAAFLTPIYQARCLRPDQFCNVYYVTSFDKVSELLLYPHFLKITATVAMVAAAKNQLPLGQRLKLFTPLMAFLAMYEKV